MCVTICGRFCPEEGIVAGYDNRIRAKYTAKWGVHIVGTVSYTHLSPLRLRFYTCTLEFTSYAIGIVIYETMY